ncbi:hypothetical protein [Paenibacillus sp. 1P07SE]|uniref:hypothetical protein n=1 Tax=Paenibacillus sp. 1P07SE TaxID=3132209 RepID=UPI0039A60C87
MTNFDKARRMMAEQYMSEKARPLERTMYKFEFECGSSDAVIAELSAFQNSDGGFGHGLEPDLRTPVSSALATTQALAILERLPDNETKRHMVERTLAYLADHYLEDRGGWEIIPRAAEDAPRAIWWRYGGFDAYWGNPNADIAAYFIDYSTVYPYTRLEELQARTIRYLLQECDLTEMHEMLCYLRFCERLDAAAQAEVDERMQQFLDNCIITEANEGYGARPLQAADSPEARYYAKYASRIPAELDSLIAEQGEDGAWAPNWSWQQYEEEWLRAKEEWKGILTLQALRTLRNYDRL